MTSDTKAIPFFMSNRSPEFFWILGLWYGDGWLSTENAIGFSGSIEVIEKIEHYIGGNRYPQKDMYDFEILIINSKKLTSWITENTGLLPGKKSHIISFPHKLLNASPKNTWHFIRGFFDADGFVSKLKEHDGMPQLKAGMSTVSPSFVDDLQTFFEEQMGFKASQVCTSKQIDDKTFACNSLTFNSKKAREFLENIYRDKNDIFYSRKYLRYVYLKNFQDNLYEAKCANCMLNPLWNYKKRLCISCFHEERKTFCICGESAFSQGVCQNQYHRYRRMKVLNLINDSSPDLTALKDRRFNDLDRSLKNKLPSFYASKHDGFVSYADHWNGKRITDLRIESEKARVESNTKAASWFKSQHAFQIVEILKERHPSISKCLDPFAGWGTRAAGVLASDLEYVGVDMNPSLIHELKSFYHEEQSCSFIEANSYQTNFTKDENFDGVDFVLTCPPYWRAEDYGYKGYSARKYTGFLRDIFKLIVNMMSLPNMKVMAICLEDFTFESKKYNFVRDFQFFLDKHGFNFEKIVYAQKYRSYYDDYLDQNVFVIECDKSLFGETFEKNRFIFSDAKCSIKDCQNKHEAKGFCKKHYLKDYYLRHNGGKLKRPLDPNRSMICKMEGCEKQVHAKGVCVTHYYHVKKPQREKKKRERNTDKKIYPCTYPGCEAQYQHKENLCKVHWLAKHGKEPGKITGRPAGKKISCKECGKPESATEAKGVCQKCYNRAYQAKWRAQKKDNEP